MVLLFSNVLYCMAWQELSLCVYYTVATYLGVYYTVGLEL